MHRDEHDDDDHGDEIEIEANLRVEQRIDGAVPFNKNYKQIIISFSPEGDTTLNGQPPLRRLAC